MLVHELEQGTEEWHSVRRGVVTASTFSKVLTAKTMQLSAQAAELENKIVAEILTGEDCESFQGNVHTERGREREAEAVDFYEMHSGLETKKIGFITNDEGTVGCSPDRLVGEDGLLEIKCPLPHTHIKSLLEGTIGDDHKPQIQGQLMITGRKWVDAFSYHPLLPPSIIRVERDEEYIGKLQAALEKLLTNVKNKIATIQGD